MAVEYLDPKKLKPCPSNARKHDDDQIRKIKQSIEKFGFNNPVLATKEMEIVAGHARIKAAVGLKLKTVPVIILSHLDKKNAKKYRIADNQLALLSSWDYDVLSKEIEEINRNEKESLPFLGFEGRELESFIAHALMEDRGSGEPDDDGEYGMPEFENEDIYIQKIIVCFKTREEVDTFSKLLDIKTTPKTKSVSFTENKEKGTSVDKSYR